MRRLEAIGVLAAGMLSCLECRADGGFVGSEPDATEPFHADDPSPRGRVFDARPELLWPVTPLGTRRVESVRVTIDGAEADARWERRGVIARPESPLAPGAYSVFAEIQLDDGWSGQARWKFEVAPAPPPAPAPSAAAHELFVQANALRKSAGLSAMTLDPRLCWAAARHSEYQRKNDAFGHDQSEGDPGYFGGDPQARAIACGFGEGVYEGVHFGPDSPRAALKSLFYAPYHRMAFLQPGPVAFGGGAAGEIFTALCASSDATALVTWPAPGQTNVLRRWEGEEIPSPLRLHAVTPGSAIGTPISFSYFTPGGESLRAESATLRDERGNAVPVFLNTPQNDDELTDTILILPKKPLLPGARYTVSVRARALPSGVSLRREWSFTTEPLPLSLKRKP